MDYILLIIAAILLAVNFAINNIYQKRQGVSMESSLKFNLWLGFFTAAIFFAGSGFQCEWNIFSLFMAVLMMLFSTTYTFIGFAVMQRGMMSLYTLFLMAGGMLVPYVCGVLFLNEPFLKVQLLGLILIISALFINHIGSKKVDGKTLVLLLSVFLLNGFVSVVSKLHQINPVAVSSNDFVTLTGAIKFIVCAVLLIPIKRSTNRENLVDENGKGKKKFIFFLITISAVISGVSYLLQLVGAKNVNATVLYPFITGGTVVFTMIVDWICFKNKPSFKIIVGAILCLLGTCLFL